MVYKVWWYIVIVSFILSIIIEIYNDSTSWNTFNEILDFFQKIFVVILILSFLIVALAVPFFIIFFNK